MSLGYTSFSSHERMARIGAATFFATIILCASPTLAITSTHSKQAHNAYADGGDRKEITASLQGREARMLVQLSPPILTNEATNRDAFFFFRLFDPATNQTFKYLSLFLFISKDNKELIAPDLYVSPQGPIKLQIERAPGDTVIYGDKDPYNGGWEADPAGIIKVKGPILQEGGLYHIHVEIFGIDNPYTIFKPEDIPKFDVYLSLGDIYHKAIANGSSSYNMTVVSYYDKVEDLSYDQNKKTLTWSMPFNYNLTRIMNESDIFVHEEVRIPWNFTDLLSSSGQHSFAGAAERMTIPTRFVLIDPYSSPNELIVHLLISKENVIKIAQHDPQINKAGTMTFTLSPGSSSNSNQTSTLLYSDRGGIIVSLSWNPSQLQAGNETQLAMKFYNQLTGNPINGDLKYDYAVFDSTGRSVLAQTDNVAKGGSDLQRLTFPSNAVYHLEINVTGISGNNSGLDPSRFGKAIGIVVVPDFGSSVALLIAGMAVAFLFVPLRMIRRSDTNQQ
jgi:hypothetical protein